MTNVDTAISKYRTYMTEIRYRKAASNKKTLRLGILLAAVSNLPDARQYQDPNG